MKAFALDAIIVADEDMRFIRIVHTVRFMLSLLIAGPGGRC